jgi:CspA family cold shock protein
VEARIQGTVKWFSGQKGYGFIAPDSGGKDLFTHHTGIEMSGYKTLEEGQRVSFIVERGPKGPQASSVCVIK